MCSSRIVCPPGRARSTARRNGFSLVELIVVIAIIVLLIATLIPSMHKSMKMASSAICMHNLREIGASLTLYRVENNGWLPMSQPQSAAMTSRSGEDEVWFLKLYPTYLPDPTVLTCPEDPFRFRLLSSRDRLEDPSVAQFCSYGINSFIMTAGGGFLANMDRYRSTRPLDTILVADLGPDSGMESRPSLVQGGRARNGSMLALDDGYDPYHGDPVRSWLTQRHGRGINMLTTGWGVREARTDDASHSLIQRYYPSCANGGCTFCRALPMYHYSFAADRLYWWTGPVPTE